MATKNICDVDLLTNITEDTKAIVEENGNLHRINIIDFYHPIGSIYMNVNEVDPAIFFGGTWEKIEDRFLLASGSAFPNGTTGGESQHTLSVNEMPAHGHDIRNVGGSGTNGLCGVGTATGVDGNNWAFVDAASDASNNASGVFGATNTGGGQPHNNMPPFVAVNVYVRVS